jgi:hypothetical protein
MKALLVRNRMYSAGPARYCPLGCSVAPGSRCNWYRDDTAMDLDTLALISLTSRG